MQFKNSIEISLFQYADKKKFVKIFTYDQFPEEIKENFSSISKIYKALKYSAKSSFVYKTAKFEMVLKEKKENHMV